MFTHKKLVIFFIIMVYSAVAVANVNLLQNGEFENEIMEYVNTEDRLFFRDAPKIIKEDDGNRCLVLTADRFIDDSKGRRLSKFGLLVGASSNDKDRAIRLKPNTTYEFSFEIKSKLPQLRFVRLRVWDELGNVENINTSIGTNEVEPEPNKWKKYTGTVKTNANTVAGALQFWNYYQKPIKEFILESGDSVYLDNIVIKERK